MNKKYMDFVPAKTAKSSVRRKSAAPKAQAKSASVYKEIPETKKAEISAAEAKAKKVGGRQVKSTKVDKVDFGGDLGKIEVVKNSYQVPTPSFINQNKVTKRPLSKNVYQKKIETPKEEPQGPVTIISKPEKDSKVGLVVTIILTIILGAAAGTVAFLLLPK